MSFRFLFIEEAVVNWIVQISGHAVCNSLYVSFARLAIVVVRFFG